MNDINAITLSWAITLTGNPLYQATWQKTDRCQLVASWRAPAACMQGDRLVSTMRHHLSWPALGAPDDSYTSSVFVHDNEEARMSQCTTVTTFEESSNGFSRTQLMDKERVCLPTIEWLAEHEHQELIGAALERVAAGQSTFADARLLAFEIGLARAGC